MSIERCSSIKKTSSVNIRVLFSFGLIDPHLLEKSVDNQSSNRFPVNIVNDCFLQLISWITKSVTSVSFCLPLIFVSAQFECEENPSNRGHRRRTSSRDPISSDSENSFALYHRPLMRNVQLWIPVRRAGRSSQSVYEKKSSGERRRTIGPRPFPRLKTDSSKKWVLVCFSIFASYSVSKNGRSVSSSRLNA